MTSPRETLLHLTPEMTSENGLQTLMAHHTHVGSCNKSTATLSTMLTSLPALDDLDDLERRDPVQTLKACYSKCEIDYPGNPYCLGGCNNKAKAELTPEQVYKVRSLTLIILLCKASRILSVEAVICHLKSCCPFGTGTFRKYAHCRSISLVTGKAAEFLWTSKLVLRHRLNDFNPWDLTKYYKKMARHRICVHKYKGNGP